MLRERPRIYAECVEVGSAPGLLWKPDMKHLLAILVVAGLALPTAGCVVRGPGHSSRASKSSKCSPSHYWDGHQCRHKGKGKGARKHDY
jgi:hypothetical protein